jgi:glycosyltransferase involved in cell wall biosynthesis
MRYAGIKNNRVCYITDYLDEKSDAKVMEVPEEFASLSAKELISNCRIFNDKMVCNVPNKPANKLKVAFVSNFCMPCGISTYFENLGPEIAKGVKDFKLFIEENDNLTGDIHKFGDFNLQDEQVISCWKRGQSLQKLVNEIKQYNPDIVLINHEFGIWPNARYWLSMLTQLSDFRIIVVMHSVFPNHNDKIVYEGSMPEIIVHLEGAKNNLLNEKLLNSRVHLIPHGCYSITNQSKLWDNYKTPYTFIQQGFGFKYKNFEDTIKATAILKEKYPSVFFTGLFSEAPQNKDGHQLYYNELMDLVESLGVQDNVGIIRGFQSDQVLDSYLRSNQVAVFPYLTIEGHKVFGSSGASRLAMSAGIPVISSTIPHFIDLPTIKADGPEQIANELDKLFSDSGLKAKQIEKQNQFILDNSWANVAAQYLKVFES